jgi:hypothetical protein
MATIPIDLSCEGTGRLRCREWTNRVTSDLDDLNRIALAAAHEVLPLCRHRGVALLVRLVPEAISIRARGKLVEKAATWLLEDVSSLACAAGGDGHVTVETCRVGRCAELRVTAGGTTGGPESSEIVLAVRRVMDAHGGSLIVAANGDETTFSMVFPAVAPGSGELGARAAVLERHPEFRPGAPPPVLSLMGPDGSGGWTTSRVPVSSEARGR